RSPLRRPAGPARRGAAGRRPAGRGPQGRGGLMARRRRATEAAAPQGLLDRLPLDAGQGADLRESGLLELALTHRSFSYEHDLLPHNERLEFLGDAVLQLAVTEHLYSAHPTLPEGDLARRRAATVSTRALPVIASNLHLGQDVSRRFVLDLLRPLLDSDEFLETGYDFKSRLQEIAAAGGTTVTYAMSESGLEHQKTFTATVTVPGIVTASGDGASKKDAE